MRRILIMAGLLICSICSSQNVFFNQMSKVHQNDERIFYRLPDDFSQTEYLAELEVQGYNPNDVDVFAKIYKKAKEIGANAFRYSPIIGVDGEKPFDPSNYRLKLYYVDNTAIPTNKNQLVVIASAQKDSRFKINGKSFSLPQRTFREFILQDGEEYRISSGNLLGSSVKLAGGQMKEVQYFQLLGFNINGNGSGILNIKSGDITMLERSFGDFLTIIYARTK